MQRSLKTPILIATAGFLAGGIMLGTMAASAEGGEGAGRGHFHKGEVAAEVLGVEVEELKSIKESGEDFEDFVLSNGFDSLDDFHEAIEASLIETWREEGVSEEEIARRVERMEERQEFREAKLGVLTELLDVTEGELKDAKQTKSFDELVEAAGYEDKSEFRKAVKAELEEQGIELPIKKHRGYHRHQ